MEEETARNGKVVSAKRRYSNSLLRLLLPASDPENYGRTSNNPSIKAREEVEARVRQIREGPTIRLGARWWPNIVSTWSRRR